MFPNSPVRVIVLLEENKPQPFQLSAVFFVLVTQVSKRMRRSRMHTAVSRVATGSNSLDWERGRVVPI